MIFYCSICGCKLVPRIETGKIVYDCPKHGVQGSYLTKRRK